MLELIGIIIVCFMSLGIGLFVIVRNPRSFLNQSFILMVCSIVFWAGTNYVANTTKDSSHVVLFSRLAFMFALFVTGSIIMFSWVFPRTVKIGVYQRLLIFLSIPLSLLIMFTSLVIADKVQYSATGTINVRGGSLYLAYLIYVISLFATSVKNLILSYKRSAIIDKYKIRLVSLGIGSSFIFVAVTSAVIPFFTGDWTISRIGPFGVLFMVASIAYAIIKHRLFDVRLVVARTVGYALSITMLATLYGVLAFNVVDVFSSSLSKGGQQVVYTMLAVVLAFTFQPLKRFFDRLSNKLFYRDAYDSQELLDGLNKILVSTLDINKLLKSSAEEINKSIRSEFVLFGIKKIEGSPQRIVGTNERQFSQQEIEFVRTITPKIRQKSIIVDELEGSELKLREVLHKNGIALLVRLTDTPNKVQEGLGYIVLGDKKSGGQYTKQDLQVLEIIADELVIAIQNALRFEEIQNFNITLQEKVDDATKKLRSANHRLIELDQTKDDFISMASHQLRTPLTTIKGYLSMVIEGDVGKVSNKQAELLSKAFISSQQMVYLIADLLNVSRLRTGKFVIEPKETNLSDVIGGEIDQLIETAKAKGLELRFENPKNFPTLMLDETKIRQVIMNFIDNAIYYTPAGGHVTVAIQDKGESIEFTVVDDGIGVPKNEQHHLFTKFYRAGNAKKARPDGTGLGLFMAKKVIIAQGGSIIFKSQEGKGSEFGFLFDKAQLLPENYKGALHKTTS